MPSVTADQWLDAAAYRRSTHGLAGTSKLPDKRVEEILTKVLAFAPSAYNTQPVRLMLITGEKHKQMWSIINEKAEPLLKGINPAIWERLGPLFKGHHDAYGSVLFWEDTESNKKASETHKATAHMFGEWGEHAQGIYQILVWTALELEGLGANLQHMNTLPPLEADIKKFVGVPEGWKLKGQLNYGDETKPHPEQPAKLPIGETLQIL